MAAQFYKINYKSDFVLTINSDAGWAVPFCIKFWTGMPLHGYFAGFDGENYVNCRVGETPTQLLVMFDDHHMPIGPLRMQIAYHTTIEEFPDRKFDEVTNPTNVTVDIDGTEYQVMLDFTGETGADIDFSMPSSGVMSVNGKIGYVTLNAEDVGAQPTIEDLATIRSGAAAGATAVQPAEMTAALATKQDTISDLATIRNGAAAGATAVQPATLQEGLATKQDTISDLATIRSGAAAGATAVQPAALQEGLATKQDVISDLSTIRSGAAAGATAVQPAALTPIESDIDAIEGKIPSAASTSNQLADKAFVNSALADKADTSDIPTALSQLSQDSTHRVVTDAEKSTWNGKQNAISDLATIRSGAAAGATAVQPAAMNTALAAKQDTLTFDNTPTANSNNPVKSSGIKTALDAKQDTISDLVTIRSGATAGSTAIQSLTVGTTTTGAAGTSASVTNTGTATAPVLSFTIPQGAQGIQGIQGPQGERGPQGNTGVQVDSVASIIHSIDSTTTYAADDVAGADAVQDVLAEVTELAGLADILQTIDAIIPSAASAQNQLADKNYVNDKIATNTANFVGTFNSLTELQAVQNPSNNDYGFVIEIDGQGNEYYDRYRYVTSSQQWLFEYKVDSTPFTAEQWAAIQSGITSALVTKLTEGAVYFGDTVGNVTTADFNAQTDTVWNKAQVLSAAQQAQARANIGAGTVSSVTVNGTTYTPTNGDVNLGSISGGGSVTVDTALSTTSTNPVQNKVIAAAIGDIETLLASI